MLKNSIYELKRTKDIIFVLAKYGFGDIIESLGVPVPFKKNKSKLSRNERIRKAIEELGPTFIKMAQLLSLRPDLIPIDLAKEFEKLQDNVSPMPFEKIKSVIEEALNKKIEDYFEGEFTLLASASIGQVYKATLKTGEIVAVKVLKPGIEDKILLDIAILQRLAEILRSRLLIYGIDSVRIVEEFAKSIKKELDFNLESLNMKRFSANFKGNNDIKIPKLYFSSKKLLVMEYIDGIKISDIKKLKESGYDLKEITKKGFDLICEQIFLHRFFHADPHPGNLMVYKNKIVFLDFGIMGRLSEEDRKYFIELIYYVIKNEEEKAAEYVLKLSKVPKEIDVSSFKKEAADIISTYFYSSLKNIELKSLMEDLLRIMNRYKIFLQEDNYLLLKSLVTMEGVGKKLYPEFNAAEEIKPFIIKTYKKIFSVFNIFKKSHELNLSIMEFFQKTPSNINEIIDKVKNGELKIEFEHVGLDEIEESMKNSFNRLSLAVIIASILIGSSMLLSFYVPPMMGHISILGLGGFVFAFVLGVLLILAIIKQK
ncbi:AarF/ABC1/UbiB kinase family protein [Lebetimonas sp. JH292]|uniref:ABC1 kinase family protein n=1 Tax=Lebetimonas sp. JH292 TaxID=990068 RepID=UPI0004659C7D|nr:AarF/UbiB family protein [Lebetimonas sp. JH292]